MEGECCPFLALLEQSRGGAVQEALAEAVVSLDAFAGKQRPGKQAVGLDLEGVNKSRQSQALITSNGNGVTAAEILHAS